MASFASQISFVLLFVLFATTFNRSVVSLSTMIHCNENDRKLLLIFKQGVVDPNNMLSSWMDEEDCCSWVGIQCDNITRRVIKVDLALNQLRGEINICLLQLEFLNHLDLSFNNFETVSMSPCQISKSPIDAHKFDNQSLATLSNQSASFSVALRYLNFSYNGLAIDDLHWLSQLSSLKYLDLSEADIGDETSWLHYMAILPSLSQLYLINCGLRDFPSMDYVNFSSLEALDLSFNNINSKLPNLFFNITNHIHHLNLGSNNFYGQLPLALLNLQNLKHLDLSDNNLKGSIPDWLGQYEQLQYLSIQINLFYGVIPSSLGNISSLFNLDLSYNQLSGNLPETLVQLHNLNSLVIGDNSWVGALSKKNFANLSNLISLDLSSTNFKFEFDSKWVPPFQLETLYMRDASIGPSVPTWLYTQRSLRVLDMYASGISKIDADPFWRFVVGIEYVDLLNNLISDDISNVTLSKKIYYFDVAHNSLSGSIFSLLCQLESTKKISFLIYLDLSYNHLSGALPDCGANCKLLEYLNLGSNKLTGEVPPSFASLNLRWLDLSYNSFFGKFSLDLFNWTTLKCLILEQNNFSGSLPNPYMVQNLQVIKLRSNQFTGNIPLEICMLSSLKILDLADNKLFGPIPYCLYNITNANKTTYWWNGQIMHIFTKGRELDYKANHFAHLGRGIIDLSANSLSGEIPKKLFSITLIWSLNLSRNHLIGKISIEIGGTKNLESLDLSYNKLFEEIPSTISNLSFLIYLNLSYNNFIGQIPVGTQIQSFDLWSFVGNPKLCGDPLPNKCNKKEEAHSSKLDEGNTDDNFLKSLYLGMGVGFAVGFWGVCGSLFLLRAWRHKFFLWFDHLVDQLYVALALSFKSFS